MGIVAGYCEMPMEPYYFNTLYVPRELWSKFTLKKHTAHSRTNRCFLTEKWPKWVVLERRAQPRHCDKEASGRKNGRSEAICKNRNRSATREPTGRVIGANSGGTGRQSRRRKRLRHKEHVRPFGILVRALRNPNFMTIRSLWGETQL